MPIAVLAIADLGRYGEGSGRIGQVKRIAIGFPAWRQLNFTLQKKDTSRAISRNADKPQKTAGYHPQIPENRRIADIFKVQDELEYLRKSNQET